MRPAIGMHDAPHRHRPHASPVSERETGDAAASGQAPHAGDASCDAGAKRPRAGSKQGRAGGDAGFTVIELIVALALMALVIALLPAALRIGGDAWRIERRLDDEQAARLAIGFLCERLAQALSVPAPTAGGPASFAGDRLSLEFAAPSPVGPAGAGVYSWALRPAAGIGQEGRGLELSIRPARAHTDAGERRRLLPERAAVRFRYWGPSQDGPPMWHDEFGRGGRLPALVELTVTTGGSTYRRIVAPRLASPED